MSIFPTESWIVVKCDKAPDSLVFDRIDYLLGFCLGSSPLVWLSRFLIMRWIRVMN